MGRLLSRDPRQSQLALEHLKKAQAGRSAMPAPMAAEVDAILQQVQN
jgi:hypothetical protein